MTLRSQLDDIQRQLRETKDELEKVKAQSRPRIDIPPIWVIRSSRRALDKTNHWNDAYDVLSAYYSIPSVECLVDESEIPKGAVACYYARSATVCGKKGGMSLFTAMHEFAHHLCHHPLKIEGEAEQAFCDSFAEAVEAAWGPT